MAAELNPNLYNELVDNAYAPPGKDPSLGCFYGAVKQIVDEGEEPLTGILVATSKGRPDLTAKHFVNLVFRAVQALEFTEENLNYREFRETGQWRNELKRIIASPTLARTFEEILRTRSTSTTIYQRYTGPYAIIASRFDGMGITVADLGCGGNYGLRGIETHEPFQPIKDLTPQRLVSTLLGYRINLVHGLAVDRENPYTKENTEWRLACSFYPQELGDLVSVRRFEERIRKNGAVKFKRADLLKTNSLPESEFDAVILSTMLYQLRPSEQVVILGKARKMISSGGIVIVQDFAARDPERPEHLDFSGSWFSIPFAYRTFVTGKFADEPFQEALQWSNGRCTTVIPGTDFDRALFVPQLNIASSAAFAHSAS